MDRYWSAFLESLGTPESYIKLALVAVTYPIWGRFAKVMWEEMKEALAPEGGLFARDERRAVRRRDPGMDPFQNIPLPGYREVLARRGRTRRPRGPRRTAQESLLAREVAGVGMPSPKDRGFKAPRKKGGF